MPFFSGEKMTGGYGGADIISSCTISVNRGEIVAILGPNGAGKSTAMKAMLGLLNLKSGKISIDGKDISKLTPQDRVKEGISFVPQSRNVFTGLSVQENLEMGAYLREERIEQIINEIYELFPVLKEKRSQIVGELSGGQRQRLAIARAILKNPPILIMDEATSSLDSESEKKVKQAIERLMKDRTVFVIAHRLSTVVNADLIIVLSDGKIVERGSHDQLLDENGHYKQLYNVQFGSIK